MGYDAIKFELIEWLTNMEDGETIDYLKISGTLMFRRTIGGRI
jgi:hypothetical protein